MSLRTSLPVYVALLAAPGAGLAKDYASVAPPPADPAQREIAALFETWNQALASGEPAKVARLYAERGVLQPTVSNWVRVGHSEIADYFQHFLALKPRGVINHREIRVLDENTAVDAGVYTFSLDKGGSVEEVQARYTYLYERIDGEWKIVVHHSSAMPEPSEQVAQN